MAKNTGQGSRKGSVKDRSQFKTPAGEHAKRNDTTGKIMDVKTTNEKPFKGVAKEPDKRRSKS
jgi:hypothetical protein